MRIIVTVELRQLMKLKLIVNRTELPYMVILYAFIVFNSIVIFIPVKYKMFILKCLHIFYLSVCLGTKKKSWYIFIRIVIVLMKKNYREIFYTLPIFVVKN